LSCEKQKKRGKKSVHKNGKCRLEWEHNFLFHSSLFYFSQATVKMRVGMVEKMKKKTRKKIVAARQTFQSKAKDGTKEMRSFQPISVCFSISFTSFHIFKVTQESQDFL
jgi:hypothetical protein